MALQYEDFVLIVDGAPGTYTVEAYGPREIRVAPVPFAYHETDEVRIELNAMRQGYAPTRAKLEAIGNLLYSALLPRPIFGAFERARGVVPAGVNLRLKLIIRPPELSGLPWELLYDADHDGFLAARLSCPVVRSIESSVPVAPLASDQRLRVLYVQANPHDTQPLNLAASEQALRTALGPRGDVTAMRATTPPALRDLLRQTPGFHVLHYDGHATFDARVDGGHLALHDAAGHTHPISGELLATYLDGSGVRLVVLAACETAVDSTKRRFTGIAHQLIRLANLPAVVAMQFAIPDDSAIRFVDGFYQALAAQYPVDAATTEGRKAILEGAGARGNPAFAAPDWATPVLFLRARDGHIFQRAPAPVPAAPGPARAAPSDAPGAAAPAPGAQQQPPLPQPTFNISGPVTGGTVNLGGTLTFARDVTIDMRGTSTLAGDLRGAQLTLTSHVTAVTEAVGALPTANPAAKDELARLVAQLGQLLSVLPAERQAEAASVLSRVEALLRELRAAQPDRELLEFNVGSLSKAAATLAELAPSLLPLAARIGEQILELLP